MPLMAYPLFMYIKHLKHLCFYTELILINSILLPISYIICIWINSYRLGVASIRPTSGIVECPRIVIKQQNNGLCLHFDF